MMTEELDFEAEIPVSLSTNGKIEKEVECSTPIVVKEEFVTEVITGDINCDAGEISCDVGEINCDTGEISCNTGEISCDTGEGTEKENLKSGTKKVESDSGGVKCDTVRAESLSDTEGKSDTGEIHSDTGEILNDDLEEGELEDIPTQTKTSEVVCRYYQRGICLYGSHCRNYHPVVYNMFDPVLSNRSNLKSFEMQNIHKPPIFHPYPMAMVPNIESSWERGIKMAKVVMQNVNSKKQSKYSDIENDWEKCLAEAKANIQNASLKRKTNYIEKPYFNSKYSKQEKFRERSPMKKEYDLKDFKQRYSKNYSSKYETESNYEMKAKPFDVKPTPDHLQFVDPWRRSKSPRKRTRSMSFSISPSPRHSRDRSASSSSSSSYFKQIYDHSPKVKPTKKKSRSHSTSPHSKKDKTLKAHPYYKKRSCSKRVSRSFSKSPRKRPYSSSSSSESSGKDYDRKKPYNKQRKLETRQEKVVDIKRGKRYSPSERPKNTSFPSTTTKSSFKKTCRRASSPSNSDTSSAGSYLTYTSVSSLTDIDDLPTTYSEEREGKNFSKRDQVPQEIKKEEHFKLNKKDFGNNQSISKTFRRLSEDFDVCLKQKKGLSDISKLQIPSEASTKSKSHSDKICVSQSITSHQTSKPTMVKKLTNQKPSAAAMELLMYHTGYTSDKSNSSSLVTKSSQAKNIPLPLEASKSKNNTYSKVPITKEVASKNTPTVPIKLNLCAANVKKEAVSKRNFLLQQLQAIEDAIARKKQPA